MMFIDDSGGVLASIILARCRYHRSPGQGGPGPAAVCRKELKHMEHMIETGENIVTVIAEPGALTFATRKEWQELPENSER